jgi:hypothetical protein
MDPLGVLDYCIYSDIENDFCSAVSEKRNGFCNTHQHYVTNIEPFLRKEKEICVSTVKSYLSSVELASGRINKAKIVNELFAFLCKHKTFMYTNNNFANTILNKLYEFGETDKDLINTDQYIMELFPFLSAELNTHDNCYNNKEICENDDNHIIEISI